MPLTDTFGSESVDAEKTAIVDGRIPITIGVVCHLHEFTCPEALAARFATEIRQLVGAFPNSPLRFLINPDSPANLALAKLAEQTCSVLELAAWDCIFVVAGQSAEMDDAGPAARIPQVCVGSATEVVDYMVRHAHLVLAVHEGVWEAAHEHTRRAVEARLKTPAAHPLGRVARHAGPFVSLALNSEQVWVRTRLDAQADAAAPSFLGSDLRELDAYNAALVSSQTPHVIVFNAVRQLCGDDVGREPGESTANALLTNAGYLDRRLLAAFGAADVLAVALQKQFNRNLKRLYVLGGVISVALWTAIEGLWRWPMAALYCAAFGAVLWLLRSLRREPLAGLRMMSRLLAETLRVELIWAVANRPLVSQRIGLVIEQLLEQHLNELGWVRNALRIGGMTPGAFGELPGNDRERVVRQWIKSQLDYSRRRRVAKGAMAKQNGRATWAFYIAGILCAAITLLLDEAGMNQSMIRHVSAIAAAIFPSFALLFQGYIDKMTVDEEIKSAARMEDVFARTYAVAEAGNQSLAPELLLQLGTEAVNETTFWVLAKRARPVSNPG